VRRRRRLEAGREGVERLHPGGPGRLGRVRFRGGLAAQVEHAEPAADLPELVGGVQHGLAGQRVRASGLLKSGVGQRVKFALVLREADDDVVAAVAKNLAMLPPMCPEPMMPIRVIPWSLRGSDAEHVADRLLVHNA